MREVSRRVSAGGSLKREAVFVFEDWGRAGWAGRQGSLTLCRLTAEPSSEARIWGAGDGTTRMGGSTPPSVGRSGWAVGDKLSTQVRGWTVSEPSLEESPGESVCPTRVGSVCVA